ncbi:MAG: hypothetical protein ACFHVJ_03275 [Aestuariibacter sp.]
MKMSFLAPRTLLAIGLLLLLIGCTGSGKPSDTVTQTQIQPSTTYSYFGPYQALPVWSDWCPVNIEPDKCRSTLQNAVQNQSSKSRPQVRAHGWQLWAGISSPLNDSGFDRQTVTSNMFGTTGCWAKDSKQNPACSGVFPLWLSWPNTGKPFEESSTTLSSVEVAENDLTSKGGLIDINLNFSAPQSDEDMLGSTQVDPNPTQTQTVNTVGTLPVYQVPAIAIAKQCDLPKQVVQASLDIAYAKGASNKVKLGAWNTLSLLCTKKGHSGVVCPNSSNPDNSGICDGSAFVNQGDVMIATESLTTQAWDAIQNNKLYGGTSTLSDLYAKGDKNIAANRVASWFTPEFVSTKHMFWPVKGCNPDVAVGGEGCRVRYGALPPWVPAKFKEKSYSTNADYLGYEQWGEVVAIDTCGADCKSATSATLELAHVTNASPITSNSPDVYPAQQFMHLQVSRETLETAFTDTDRALLDQATVWAYGDESNGFEAGDFLIVVAMHVLTKEIDTWAFQSVWWSPMDDKLADCPVTSYNNCFGQAGAYSATDQRYSGLNDATISQLDSLVGTTWRDNYLLTDSYGIGYEIDGTQIMTSNYFPDTPPKWATQRPDGEAITMLPVSMNPYIEPVIHPLGTNCQNCHRRAGAVSNSPGQGEYAGGVGRANYQNAQCPSLLGDYGMPGTDACLMDPWAWNQNTKWDEKANNNCQAKDGTLCKSTQVAYPIVNTDLSWFVADGHVQGATK